MKVSSKTVFGIPSYDNDVNYERVRSNTYEK